MIRYNNMGQEEINFQYVQPTDEQKELMQYFRDKFQEIGNEIIAKVGSSRGKSLALTKLEETSFWLNKGITNNS
jgi:hypothetical protein